MPRKRSVEDNLVLQVEGLAFDMFEKVRAGTFAVGLGLAVDRVVDVDSVGAAGEAGDPLVLAVVLVFAADQQFMLPTADVEQAAQFQLGDAVMPVVVALAITAVDGVAVGIQRTSFRGEAPEFAFLVVAGQAQFPAVVEVMFQRGLQQVVVVVDVAVVRFTEEGRARDATPFIVRRDNATIEGGAVTHDFAFYQQRLCPGSAAN